MRVLDLFSGIGGFSLGLERAGMQTVAFCEIEPFPRAVLKKHWPEVPCYEDVRTLTAERLAADGIEVDVICGGFPCQPFSSAARGRNNAFDFWPEMARVVSEIRPKIVIAENVKRDPIRRAAKHFVGMGMQCDVIRISADDFGADHKRVRWWAVAHPYENSEFSSALNAEASKLHEICKGVWSAENFRTAVCVSDGLSPGMDGVAEFGNAVVPQIPEMIGRAVMEQHQ